MKGLNPGALGGKINSFEKDDRERVLGALEGAEEISLGAASTLIDLGLDADTVIAALIPGGPVAESVAGQFGSRALGLKNGVETIRRVPAASKTMSEARNIRNMLFALTGDIRVILILIAQKLNALRLPGSTGEEERRALGQECLDIYAPLADRLGLSRIKDEMEDLSLKLINREAYQQIKDLVAEKREQRLRFLDAAPRILRKEAEAMGIEVEVSGRAKHFYSIYMKMRKRGVSANKIFDLSGIRVLCGSVENCYTLLGIVHRIWKPLSGTFKDYIARPKPNGYQSLHTSVLADAGDPAEGGTRLLEIQIRTREMHEIAENGVASHWLYKKSSSRDMVRPEDIGIVNRLKDWKRDEGSWLEEIKGEILSEWVYVFTPQGKVIRLPAGSTPLDFAYHIHTAVGERCIGAKANGAIIPLGSALKNTQTVEILTSPGARPHFNWLGLVKTSRARAKIRSWLERNDESFVQEKTPGESQKPLQETSPVTVNESPPPQRVIQPDKDVLRVTIEDEKNLLVRFARCCNPVTGDAIIGYVSRGRGIIIHRKNCANLAHVPEFEERKIDAEWEKTDSVLVKRFRIEARPSANVFSEIESAVRKRQGHLIEGRLEETSANRLAGFFTIQLELAGALKAVVRNIRGIPGILSLQEIN